VLANHSGGRVGRGIYFASENEKSAGYVGRSGNIGIMFLNEVCLGKEYNITRDDHSLRHAPAVHSLYFASALLLSCVHLTHWAPLQGFDSVVARGHHEPDPSKDTVQIAVM